MVMIRPQQSKCVGGYAIVVAPRTAGNNAVIVQSYVAIAPSVTVHRLVSSELLYPQENRGTEELCFCTARKNGGKHRTKSSCVLLSLSL